MKVRAAFTKILNRSGGETNAAEPVTEPASATAVAEKSTHDQGATNTTRREVRPVTSARRHQPYTRALLTNHIVDDSPGRRLVIAPTAAVQTSVARVEGIVRVLDAYSNHHARRVAAAVDNGVRLKKFRQAPDQPFQWKMSLLSRK